MARLLAVWVTCAFCRGSARPEIWGRQLLSGCGVNRMIAVRPPAVSCPTCAGRGAGGRPALGRGGACRPDRYGSGQKIAASRQWRSPRSARSRGTRRGVHEQ